MCNENSLTCIDTTKNPEDRIRIKKPAFAISHRFWYLQNISYYTNAPGVKKGGGEDEGERRETDGGRERRERKKKRLECKNNHERFISSKIQ